MFTSNFIVSGRWDTIFASLWQVNIPLLVPCTLHPRYFPVANLTRTRQAVIIEPLRPEKFYVRTFNATSLYILRSVTGRLAQAQLIETI